LFSREKQDHFQKDPAAERTAVANRKQNLKIRTGIER